PDYIAPEQIEDVHHADIRADLYSLGCSLYHLLTGQVPFPGGTLGVKLLKHQTAEPESVETLRPDVPAAVAAIVRRLMAKHPEERFQTPAESPAALTAIRSGAVTADSVMPPAPVSPFADLERADTPVPPAPPRRQPRRRLLLGAALVGALAVLGVVVALVWPP